MKYLIAFFSLILFFSCSSELRDGNPKLLVFYKTAGYKHESIPDGIAAIKKLGEENNFNIDTTSNSELFNESTLSQYSAVVFLNTTEDVLNFEQEVAFERYIQAGGNYVGVHSAADTEYGWNWYGRLAGAFFLSHPATQEADFIVHQHDCPACSGALDSIWTRTDELYNFKNINEDINVILSVDESSYEGGENGESHPMSWYHEYDGGRAFYTALGHTKESYSEPKFLAHLLSGIQYAIGDNQKLDYSKAKTPLPPNGSRFSKNIMSQGEFTEPTEMTILPNNDVLIAQRRGELMLYKSATSELTQVAKLDVYHKTNVKGVNAEEGFMGLQKDPNFADNHWIYTYYSPTGDKWVNRLSRFKFENGQFDLASEQIILEVESQRDICCHTGGSIAFGPGGLLYLSSGDNSTPFDEPKAKYVNNGYAPLNDLPGKQQYDARRSSGNTNDLRGKIMRIKVNEDGTYSIPEGNLFPVGTDKTRPEIYTMGHRNPYRISVDPKNGYVYWGDVGPDARDDAIDTRGPRGYDEMNQAREAGNYGWPLFIGDNKPYRAYNYATGESGEPFDPAAPVNNSKNNTGLTNLPPANGAYVFYDYGESKLYKEVSSGGRNAMAGPVFYADMFEGAQTLPTYYDGKVIIYDWMRGWMKAVTLNQKGEFERLEPFAPDVKLNNLIDMELGPDGTLYLLEYGTGWFTKNENSALSSLTFNAGNQPPVVQSMSIDHNSGALPLTVNASVKATDMEESNLTYKWDFGDGNTKETKTPEVSYTYKDGGAYDLSVEVSDDQGASTISDIKKIVSGNTRPSLAIQVSEGNSSFFLPGMPIKYNVDASDVEDGDNIDMSRVSVTVDYMDGFDEAALTMGHQEVSDVELGESLALTLICKACHKANTKSIGPSYLDISEKYKNQEGAVAYLQGKIKAGGSGVWGQVSMPANPEITPDETNKIAQYILSLSKEAENALPAAGIIIPEAGNQGKTLVLTASYTDQGAENSVPLTGMNRIGIQSSTLSMTAVTDVKNYNPMKFGNMDLLLSARDGGSFALEDIDLTGIQLITISAGWQEAPKGDYSMTARLNSVDGEIIASGYMPIPKKGSPGSLISFRLKKPINQKVDKLYFVYAPEEAKKLSPTEMIALSGVTFSIE